MLGRQWITEKELLAQYRSGQRDFRNVRILHDWPFREPGCSLQPDDPIPAQLRNVDLSRAYLYGASLAGADLQGARLIEAKLELSDLRHTKLMNAILRDARLVAADFTGADLSYADLKGAWLTEAVVRAARCHGTDFRGADLTGTRFGGDHAVITWGGRGDGSRETGHIYGGPVDLSEADFAESVFGATVFLGVDLSCCKSLDQARHIERSMFDLETLRATADGLAQNPSSLKKVATFLRAAGVEELMIGYFRNLTSTPAEFFPCFISYSHADKEFAQRLYEALQQYGVRCWIDVRDMAPGERILEAMDRAILAHDRVLLCCSKSSLASSWVEDEIAMAFEKERQSGRTILIALNLDDYMFRGWRSGKGPRIRERLAANFVGWESNDQIFLSGVEKLIVALRRT